MSVSVSQGEATEAQRLEQRLLRSQLGSLRLDQGEFGEAWIRLLAAAAGLDCAQQKVERSMSDFLLTYPERIGRLAEWTIKVQVKTTADPAYDSGSIVYDLEASAHRGLAGLSQMPAYLFLVTVGAHRDSWVQSWGHADTLSYGAYWLSLRDESPTDNEHRKRVRVPLTNRLTPARIRGLCVETARQYLAGMALTEGGAA